MTNREDISPNAGMELRIARTKKNLSLRKVAEQVGVSTNYLSMIERMIKTPSDDILRKLAVIYEVDEKALSDLYNRVPLTVQEELTGNDRLSRLLLEISSNHELDNEDKEKLYDAIEKLYKSHISN